MLDSGPGEELGPGSAMWRDCALFIENPDILKGDTWIGGSCEVDGCGLRGSFPASPLWDEYCRLSPACRLEGLSGRGLRGGLEVGG